MMPHWAKAQITASNPLEWMALAEGNEVINDQIEKQINGQTKTAMLQNSIAAEFNRIHNGRSNITAISRRQAAMLHH